MNQLQILKYIQRYIVQLIVWANSLGIVKQYKIRNMLLHQLV